LHREVCETLGDLRLMDVLIEEVDLCLPKIYNHDMAIVAWNSLSSVIKNNDDVYNVMASFLKPESKSTFEPYLFPGRWTPEEWYHPLSPSEVLQNLRLSDKDIDNLKSSIEHFINRLSFSHRNHHLGTVDYDGEIQSKKPKLTIGVSSYSDCLALHALIYAISDINEFKDSIKFVAASFYDEKDQSGDSLQIINGKYDCGYATESQIAEIRQVSSNYSIIDTSVYERSFSRSIILEMPSNKNNSIQREYTIKNHLSFIGPSLPIPEGKTIIIHEQGLRLRTNIETETISIAEKLKNIVEWEMALLLNFMGTSCKRHISQDNKYALSLSTDGHIWATHFNLFSPAIIPVKINEAMIDKNPIIQSHYWNEEGTSARLYWFFRVNEDSNKIDEDQLFAKQLTVLIKKYIIDPINTSWDKIEKTTPNTNKITDIRKTLRPLAQALLAPLLIANPNYNGPLLWLPPEAALSKIRSYDGHIRYKPLWMRNLQVHTDPEGSQNATYLGKAQGKLA